MTWAPHFLRLACSKIRLCIFVVLASASLVCMTLSAEAQSRLSSARMIDGFNKTVFGAEYTSFGRQPLYVRKFTREVRFYIDAQSRKKRSNRVRKCILSLNNAISGLKTRIVSNPINANFRVYVVDSPDYADTVRNKVYRRSNARVIGRCMVRSVFSRAGIQRSDAVIVSDQGEKLFRRCMIEEILQGLGPLNEDRSLRYSVFNDASRQTSFTRHDRIIMNMLYDKRLKNGTSQNKAQALLPALYKTARKRVR